MFRIRFPIFEKENSFNFDSTDWIVFHVSCLISRNILFSDSKFEILRTEKNDNAF